VGGGRRRGFCEDAQKSRLAGAAGFGRAGKSQITDFRAMCRRRPEPPALSQSFYMRGRIAGAAGEMAGACGVWAEAPGADARRPWVI
jgi:hypothetical protein